LSSLHETTPHTRKYPAKSDKILVPVSTVDDYMAEVGVESISILKIDTEGNEVAVLKGARRAIEQPLIDHIYLEFNAITSENQGLPLAEAAGMLESRGYRFIGAYTDSVAFDDGEHVVANALFTRLKGHARDLVAA
jgi:hypothetical protein